MSHHKLGIIEPAELRQCLRCEHEGFLSHYPVDGGYCQRCWCKDAVTLRRKMRDRLRAPYELAHEVLLLQEELLSLVMRKEGMSVFDEEQELRWLDEQRLDEEASAEQEGTT